MERARKARVGDLVEAVDIANGKRKNGCVVHLGERVAERKAPIPPPLLSMTGFGANLGCLFGLTALIFDSEDYARQAKVGGADTWRWIALGELPCGMALERAKADEWLRLPPPNMLS